MLEPRNTKLAIAAGCPQSLVEDGARVSLKFLNPKTPKLWNVPEDHVHGVFSEQASPSGVRDGQAHLPTSPWGPASSPSLPTHPSSHWERLVLASTLPLPPYLKISGLLQAASLPRGASLSPLALCPMPGTSLLGAGELRSFSSLFIFLIRVWTCVFPIAYYFMAFTTTRA